MTLFLVPFIDIINQSLRIMLTFAPVKRSHSIPINIGTYFSRLKVTKSICLLSLVEKKEISSAGWKINALIKKTKRSAVLHISCFPYMSVKAAVQVVFPLLSNEICCEQINQSNHLYNI